MVEKKKQIPGFSQGVRRNASTRTIKMVQPICPNSKQDMIRTPEGRYIPNPEPDPTRQSCQEDRDENGNSRIGWWNACEERGHNPYFTKRVWYSSEDIFDENDVMTGTKRVRHEIERPNISQVAANIRVNSGRGPLIKQRASGFKRLADLGYEEVCEFRNCQNPATVTSAVGGFCGNEHAQLCAADFFGVYDYQVPNSGVLANQEIIDNGRRRKSRQFMAEAAEVAQARPIK